MNTFAQIEIGQRCRVHLDGESPEDVVRLAPNPWWPWANAAKMDGFCLSVPESEKVGEALPIIRCNPANQAAGKLAKGGRPRTEGMMRMVEQLRGIGRGGFAVLGPLEDKATLVGRLHYAREIGHLPMDFRTGRVGGLIVAFRGPFKPSVRDLKGE